MTHEYSISGWITPESGPRKLVSASVRSSAIIAEFKRLGRPVPQSLAEIVANGIRYSYQDFDVLGAAMRELGVGAYNRLAHYVTFA